MLIVRSFRNSFSGRLRTIPCGLYGTNQRLRRCGPLHKRELASKVDGGAFDPWDLRQRTLDSAGATATGHTADR
jgi:hypothetical protein